jgi:hypothetical protein
VTVPGPNNGLMGDEWNFSNDHIHTVVHFFFVHEQYFVREKSIYDYFGEG